MKNILWITLALLFGRGSLRSQVRPETLLSDDPDTGSSSLVNNPFIRNGDMNKEEPLEKQMHLDLSKQSLALMSTESGGAEEHAPLQRSLVLQPNADEINPQPFDSTAVDSFPPIVKPKLLPDDMSIMERGLWGEHGVLRGIGIASPLTPEVRKHELAVRRTMLTMHQIGGFLTLGSMLTAVYFGQKSLNSPYTGQRNDPYRSSHQTFVATTIGLYAATGLLAILSPPPLIRRDETSTITIHKTLAWIHVAGMIITPILGKQIFKRGPVGRYADINQARYHQISAYITTAVFAASLIVVTF